MGFKRIWKVWQINIGKIDVDVKFKGRKLIEIGKTLIRPKGHTINSQ